MKHDSLIFGGIAIIAILYFWTQSKTQAAANNLSGLNNSFPTFNLLYPITADAYVPTSVYSGYSTGMPVMGEAYPNPVYYNSASYGSPVYQGDQNGNVFSLLGSMFGG